MTPAGSPYHHGDLRAALVQTATELARTDGPDGVVLRETARIAAASSANALLATAVISSVRSAKCR